jgi:predicted metal-binding protein
VTLCPGTKVTWVILAHITLKQTADIQAVTFKTCILKVRCSNLCRDTA